MKRQPRYKALVSVGLLGVRVRSFNVELDDTMLTVGELEGRGQ
jgi:hypothetical protein